MTSEADGGYNDIQQNSSNVPALAPAAPLQHYFTLPFALHLRPLPHINFLAYQDSQDTSEAEQSDQGNSSLNRNTFRSGTHRLEPTLQPVPPHSLSTISTLLERTGCLEAVPIWSELISLLDQADEDAHFTNLRAFFDARFDSQGRLISDKKVIEEEESNRLKSGSNVNIFKKRADSLIRRTSAQGQTPSRQSPQLGTAEEICRRGSNVSRRKSNPAATRTRSRNRMGSKYGVKGESEAVIDSDEEGASIRSGDLIPQSPTFLSSHQRQLSRASSRFTQNQSQKQYFANYAPEILVTQKATNATKDTQSQVRANSVRPIRFRIRLDLHNVNLSPRPPQAQLSSLRPITTSDLQSGNSRAKGGKTDFSEDCLAKNRQAISPRAGSSSDQSHNESLNLYPVTSPDSLRSRTISEGSRSDEHRLGKSISRGRDGLAVTSSPSRNGKNPRNESFSGKARSATRTMTGSSAATAQTSVFGTSSEAGENPRKNSFGGRQRNLTSSGDKRRPSLLQRFISFGGKRGRRRSNTPSIEQSVYSLEEVSSIDSGSNTRVISNKAQIKQPAFESRSESLSSPVMIEKPGKPSIALAMQSQVAGSSSDRRNRMKSADHSDLSNEEAIDLADDDGSVGSTGWSNVKYRRKSSAGPMSPNMVSLQPVDEDGVFEDAKFSTTLKNGIANDTKKDEVGGENSLEDSDWTEKGDFLSLLRRASEITLHLKKDAQKKRKVDEDILRTPKSSSTINSQHSPSEETEINDKLKMEALLKPYLEMGHEENPDSWWLYGSADPLPITFACALSQALGWQGIMDLCYGKGSRSEKSEVYKSLSKAAEMNDRQEMHVNKVRNWVQNVTSNDDTMSDGQNENSMIESDARQKSTENQERERFTNDSNGGHSDVAPSESASAAEKTVKAGLLSKFMNKLPTIRNPDEEAEEVRVSTFNLNNNDDSTSVMKEYSNRNWQDWSDLFTSIASWMEEYETCRVRNGLARELDREASKEKASSEKHTDSGFVDISPLIKDEEKVVYSTLASFCVPRGVILDALNENNGFRRRHGIPEGLPIGPDGEEHEDYRWARKKLTSSQFTTSLLLGSLSLSYFFGQMTSSDWTYNSAWELDYLEMCVFHSDIISSRFPSPGTSIIPSEQMYQPQDDDLEGNKRAKTCPYPKGNSWHSEDWQKWLDSVKSGLILVPAVSFQAWWTLIAVLNGADGSGRNLDLQVKSAEEPFEALDDLNSIYM